MTAHLCISLAHSSALAPTWPIAPASPRTPPTRRPAVRRSRWMRLWSRPPSLRRQRKAFAQTSRRSPEWGHSRTWRTPPAAVLGWTALWATQWGRTQRRCPWLADCSTIRACKCAHCTDIVEATPTYGIPMPRVHSNCPTAESRSMSGQGLKVFFDLFSQPSRAVLLLLNANKVPYEPVMLKLAQGRDCSCPSSYTETMLGDLCSMILHRWLHNTRGLTWSQSK